MHTFWVNRNYKYPADKRDILQKTAERALPFIFDHCDDSQFCSTTATLVNGMWELCNQEKQFQGEIGMGMGGNAGSSVSAQPANIAPRPPRLNETIARISGLGGSRGE